MGAYGFNGQMGSELLEVHPAGRKRCPASAWIAGRGISTEDRFDLSLS